MTRRERTVLPKKNVAAPMLEGVAVPLAHAHPSPSSFWCLRCCCYVVTYASCSSYGRVWARGPPPTTAALLPPAARGPQRPNDCCVPPSLPACTANDAQSTTVAPPTYPHTSPAQRLPPPITDDWRLRPFLTPATAARSCPSPASVLPGAQVACTASENVTKRIRIITQCQAAILCCVRT